MENTCSLNEIKFYQDNGYLIKENFFPLERIQRIRQIIEELLTSPNLQDIAEIEPADSTVVRRLWSPTKQHPYFMEMAKSDLLLDVIEQLIGPNILYHYSKLNMKGPRVGSVVEWHQDLAYYPHTNTDLLSCLIYLDDATKENGCLQVMPCSHKNGILNHYEGSYFKGKVAREIIHNQPTKAVYLEAPAGSVIFLHCLALHASDKNTSNSQRRAFISAYRAADAYPIYYGPHASHNEPTIQLLRGQTSNKARMEQQDFPLPITEKSFGSLYELQEGTTSSNNVGYHTDADKAADW